MNREVVTTPEDIAKVLTDHWQSVFEHKQTDASLRREWLQGLSRRMHVSIEELTPTIGDVMDVLNCLPKSAPGPDGIPFI
eukprot:2022903-Karenia_brevis.AAC.1